MVNTGNKKEQQLDVDVLVAGGGPAGLGAALGASRLGVRTLLVERMGFLGGVAAIGLGMTMYGMLQDGKPRSKIHGALIEQLQKFGDSALRIKVGEVERWRGPPEVLVKKDALVTNPEYLKLAAFLILEESGCDYLLHSFISDAIVERDVVKGVVVSGKGGPLRVNAKRVVDATGDGDVCFSAGCPMVKGREEDGGFAAMTSLFIIGGVDQTKVMDHPDKEPRYLNLLKEAKRAGYEVPEPWIRMSPTVFPGSVCVNHSGIRSHGVFDGTDPFDLTKAERIMRQQAVDVVRFLRDRHVPGFANAYLQQVSAWAGVRETRRIVGEYVMTKEDTVTGARFSDAIALRFPPNDNGDGTTSALIHDLPYRALIPQKTDNILASGRLVSSTHAASGCGRCIGGAMATGHAAGVAAALSIREGVTPRDLNAKLVRERLAKDGVDLEV